MPYITEHESIVDYLKREGLYDSYVKDETFVGIAIMQNTTGYFMFHVKRNDGTFEIVEYFDYPRYYNVYRYHKTIHG